jgi:hypothetical protein
MSKYVKCKAEQEMQNQHIQHEQQHNRNHNTHQGTATSNGSYTPALHFDDEAVNQLIRRSAQEGSMIRMSWVRHDMDEREGNDGLNSSK